MSDSEPQAGDAPARARPIVAYGDPVLEIECAPVDSFGEELRALVEEMFLAMWAVRGVGLAANQIGVDARVFVLDCPGADGRRVVGHVVNPVLEPPVVRELEVDVEGCLSLPGAHAEVPRLSRIAVTGSDWRGEPVRIEATGLAARCLQHEVDHLNGRLYIDRLPHRIRRELLRSSTQGSP